MEKLKQGAIGIVLLGIAASGNAALLTWNLQGTGLDGSVASGFLEFDAQGLSLATAVGDFDISITAGNDPLFSDIEFTPADTNVLSFTSAGSITMQTKQPTATIDRHLSVAPVFPGALTDAGGTVSITITDIRIQGSTEFPINKVRSLTGVATAATAAVPEPSSYAFLAIGVLALTGLLKKRLR